MVYTLTLNPAIDYMVWLDRLEPGAIHRARREQLRVGGKGINVSTVLGRLGVESVALGFLAGLTGQAAERELRAQGLRTAFIHLAQGFTRINVKIQDGGETQLNGQGPQVGAEDLERLLSSLDALSAGDVLVLAGSLPGSLSPDTYARTLDRLEGRGVLTVVDTQGEALSQALRCRPFLIKPNLPELGGLFGRQMGTSEEIQACAAALQRRGARNVLVSMAGDGAMLLDEQGGLHLLAAPRGEVRSSVGAGDSMVAGFLAGWLESGSYAQALRMGVAAGSATAFSGGLALREEVQALLPQLRVEQR